MRLPRLTKPYKLRDYKFSLVLLVFALSVIGVMVVGSAKASVQNKQIFGVCVGFILMMIISLIDYIWILNFLLDYIRSRNIKFVICTCLRTHSQRRKALD